MAGHGTVRDLVEAFTADLEELIRAEIRRGFETALGVAAPVAARRPKRAAAETTRQAPVASSVSSKFSRPGRRKGEKRTPEQLAALKAALHAFVQKHPGKRVEEIGREMKMPTKDLARPLRQLVDAKRVKTTGFKRATKYFPA